MKKNNSGFLAASLGASCCILPLALIALGLGGSLLTVVLVRYKAYLMTMAAAALLYSWMQLRRDVRQCSAQACVVAGGRLRKWLLGVNTAVVAFFFLITYTPLGVLVSVDAGEGANLLTAEAVLPPGPRNPCSPAAPVAEANRSGRTNGAVRMQRLALRVEGMT